MARDGGSGGKEVSSAAAFRDALVTSSNGMKEAVQKLVQGVTETLGLEPDEKKMQTLHPVFDSLQRTSLELLESLSGADTQTHREGLKAQENIFKMKLASSRTAASVSMKNAAAELEASFNTQMQAKLSALSSGSAGEARALQEQVAELQEELQSAKNGNSKLEEMLKQLRGVLRSKETEAEEKAKEVDELKVWVENSKGETARATRIISEANGRLRASLREAAAEAERAAMQSPQECKVLTHALAERLRAELDDAATKGPGGSETHDQQLARLLERLEEMARQLADTKAEAEREKISSRQKIENTTKLLEDTRKQLADAQTQVLLLPQTPGDDRDDVAVVRQQLRNSQGELERLKVDLTKAMKVTEDKKKEAAQAEVRADAIYRDMLETLSRAISEAQRATMLGAKECKEQVRAMVERLKAELEAARKGATESASDQLNRLLDELGGLSNTITEMQLRLADAQSGSKDSAATTARVKQLESDERKTRELIAQAVAEAQLKSAQHAPPSEQLRQLVVYYRAQQLEAYQLRMVLDKALRDVALAVSETASLGDKLKQVLEQHKIKSVQAEAHKAAVEHARAELNAKVSEAVSLREHVKQLSDQSRGTYEREQLLRATIKQQQASLHGAYERIKAVEMELNRARGAAMEERDSLVHTALHALYQLRTHLGSIHALRPEVTQPIDEVRPPPALSTLAQAPLRKHPCASTLAQSCSRTCRILFSIRVLPWYPRRRSWSSEPWSRRSRCHPLNGCSTATQKVFQLCKCRIVHRRLMLVSKSSWQRWATPPSSQVPLTSLRCRHPKHRRRCRRHRCSPRKTPVHHACTNRSRKLAYLRSHSAVACFVCPIHQRTARW
jgi:chromosome segregation ATPase